MLSTNAFFGLAFSYTFYSKESTLGLLLVRHDVVQSLTNM